MSAGQLIRGSDRHRFVFESNVKRVGRAFAPSGAFLNQIVVELAADECVGIAEAKHVLSGYSQLFSPGGTDGLVRDLAQLGLVVGRAEAKALPEQLLDACTLHSYVVLERSGYHCIEREGERWECMVHRQQVCWFDEAPDFPVLCMAPCVHPAAAGTLEDWQRMVEPHLAANPYLLVGLGAALFAALHRPLALPNMTYSLVGASSVGKSASQTVIQSVIGPGLPLATAAGTTLGLRQLLAQHPDQPVLLQELRQMQEPVAWPQLVFDLANGAERVVATADQKIKQSPVLACSVITSNERTLAEMVVGRGVTVDGGTYARIFEVQMSGKFGAFDSVPSQSSAAEYADELVRLSLAFHGSVWNAWIPASAMHMRRIRKAAAIRIQPRAEKLIGSANVSDPVSKRMVGGLARWEFALLIASKLKILRTSPEQIRSAFELVLRRHQQSLASGRTPFQQAVFKAVRAELDMNGHLYLPLTSSAFSEAKARGFVQVVGGATRYLVYDHVFEQIVGRFGVRDAARELGSAGFLVSNLPKRTLSVHIPGTPRNERARFFAVLSTIRLES